MIAQRGRPRFTVRLEVPRTGSLRAWGAVAGDFEREPGAQVSPVVSEARVESQAAAIAWDDFRTAVSEDAAA